MTDEKRSSGVVRQPGKKPGFMYYVLMLVALACVIYGIYGWVTGKW
ncbi:MAG TPA: hypothetical protein O0X97_05565 [Methanocorpusculum sp.]|nr:hypothetical protein [Methanocorpusculum sp.]